jgi:hypothetical protein
MGLAREYLHHLSGYGLGVCYFWVSVYEGGASDAPVVVCSAPEGADGREKAGLGEASKYMAAEVIEHGLSRGLPDLPRPLLWIERHRSVPGDHYYLLDFPVYRPLPTRPGFVRALALGSPARMELTAEEVALLTGERLLYS